MYDESDTEDQIMAEQDHGNLELNTGLADEVRKSKDKLMQCFTDVDAITPEEFKSGEDLSQHADWFLKVIKCAKKLQDAVNEDFLGTVVKSDQYYQQYRQEMVRNQELTEQLAAARGTEGDEENDNDGSFIMAPSGG